MAKTHNVIVSVQEGQEVTIKSVAAKVAQPAAAPAEGNPTPLVTGTATVTGGIPNGGDGDADVDF